MVFDMMDSKNYIEINFMFSIMENILNFVSRTEFSGISGNIDFCVPFLGLIDEVPFMT